MVCIPPVAMAKGFVLNRLHQATINRSVSRYETTAVYTHPDAKVDIVLVHGLNGCPDKTWTSKDGVFWPVDLLPASLKGLQANILVYGYNADVYSRRNDRSASDNFIHQHAQTLVTSLTLFRKSEGTFKNPIIWVAHSLGGILVKRALLYSNDVRSSHHEDYRSIYVSTFGLMFLGTPHTGSDMATWGLVLQGMSDAIMPKKFFESESVLLKTLKKDNETLSNINNHFLDIYQRFRIHMAHENHKTDIKGTKYATPSTMYILAHANLTQDARRRCQLGQPTAPRRHVLRRRGDARPDVQVFERQRPWLPRAVDRHQAVGHGRAGAHRRAVAGGGAGARDAHEARDPREDVPICESAHGCGWCC